MKKEILNYLCLLWILIISWLIAVSITTAIKMAPVLNSYVDKLNECKNETKALHKYIDSNQSRCDKFVNDRCVCVLWNNDENQPPLSTAQICSQGKNL
jgi:hypothetical protein